MIGPSALCFPRVALAFENSGGLDHTAVNPVVEHPGGDATNATDNHGSVLVRTASHAAISTQHCSDVKKLFSDSASVSVMGGRLRRVRTLRNSEPAGENLGAGMKPPAIACFRQRTAPLARIDAT